MNLEEEEFARIESLPSIAMKENYVLAGRGVSLQHQSSFSPFFGQAENWKKKHLGGD